MINSAGSAIKFIFKLISGIGTVFMGLFVLMLLFFLWIGMSVDNTPKVPDGAALVIAPEGVVVEQVRVPDPLEVILDEYDYSDRPRETSVHDLLAAIERAADDDRIPGLVIFTDPMLGAAPATVHALAEAIGTFKEKSGKPVYAISTSYDQSDYLIAAQADKIFLNNYGSVILSGYGTYPTYFRGLLDNIGATVNEFRVGTFKSATEPLTRTDMSPAAREANEARLSVMWNDYTSAVEEARGLEAGQIDRRLSTIAANLQEARGDLAALAKNDGLVDAVVPRHVWRKELIDEFGANEDGSTFHQINFKTYLAATKDMRKRSDNRIAVIVAQGPIVMGDGNETVTAAETTVRRIRQARRDNSIKAIVLRVDSPGGSAFASELIRQELLAAQADGKPVIASFGSVAASGGYWISASADEIWAQPSTITGSIGIFGMFVTFENTLQKVGITSDGVGTTDLAGGISAARPLNDTIKDIVQQNIEQGYDRFIQIVAEGREMTPNDVDKIAQGRVWAGSTAFDLGLVDHLGGLKDAVASAARAAGIEDDNYQVAFSQPRVDPFDQWLIDTFGSAGLGSHLSDNAGGMATSDISKLAAQIKADAERLMQFNDPMGHYALCEDCGVR